MTWLALDVGGANLKIADGRGYAASQPFALWKSPDKLVDRLAELINGAPDYDRIALTMTGELADCYATKADGVRAIVDATVQAAEWRKILVYLTTGEFAPPDRAIAEPLLAAASNWHALASFAARYCGDAPGLLIDLGSTTADVIPIAAGAPTAVGATDPERLATGELVYTGVERTPIAVLVDALPLGGEDIPVAAELFATTGDAYLLLAEIAEDESDRSTADGRPKTVAAAHARMARMLCCDVETMSLDNARRAGAIIRNVQLDKLESAARCVIDAMDSLPVTVVLSGHGEFLSRQLIEQLNMKAPVISLSDKLGSELNRCATAHALAVLATERIGH